MPRCALGGQRVGSAPPTATNRHPRAAAGCCEIDRRLKRSPRYPAIWREYPSWRVNGAEGKGVDQAWNIGRWKRLPGLVAWAIGSYDPLQVVRRHGRFSKYCINNSYRLLGSDVFRWAGSRDGSMAAHTAGTIVLVRARHVLRPCGRNWRFRDCPYQVGFGQRHFYGFVCLSFGAHAFHRSIGHVLRVRRLRMNHETSRDWRIVELAPNQSVRKPPSTPGARAPASGS